MGDPEGMICKVAEAQGLRDSFPTMIGGMFLRDEMDGGEVPTTPAPEVKRPAFNGPTPPGLPEPDRTTQPVDATADPKRTRKRPTMVEAPLDQPTPTVQAEPATNPTAASGLHDSPTVPPTPPVTETPGEKELRELNDALKKLCADAAISEEQLVAYMRAEKWLKRPEQKKPSDMAGNMLKLFIKGWQGDPAGMVKNIQVVLKKQ